MGFIFCRLCYKNGITRVGLANMVASADGNGTPNGTTTFFYCTWNIRSYSK